MADLLQHEFAVWEILLAAGPLCLLAVLFAAARDTRRERAQRAAEREAWRVP